MVGSGGRAVSTAYSPDPPASAEELYQQDGTYIKSLVRRQLGHGAGEQDVEDIAQEIICKLVARDVISMYDPDHASGARWRTFLGRQVLLYVRGMGETLGRRHSRELAILDDSEGGGWADLLGASAWDDYARLDDDEFLARMREHIASVPEWKGPVSLVALFDLTVTRLKGGENGLPPRKQVQEHFGVSASAARHGLAQLRQRLGAVLRYAAPPVRLDVGGVSLTLSQARDSLTALRISRGNRVAPALASVGSPLAAKDTKWYIRVGRAEVRAHPECKVAKGDKTTHGSQTKVALIHLLERLLAPLGEEPPAANLAATGSTLAVNEPAVSSEPDESPAPEEVLEARLWHLQGMTPETVDEILTLAREAFGS